MIETKTTETTENTMENPMHEYGCRFGLGDGQNLCRDCGTPCDGTHCRECRELIEADIERDED